jgi:uncharacterized phage protein (TIGR02218 family)
VRTLPPGLQAHLDSGATTLCWCWLLRTQGGDTLGFTDHDADIAFDGAAYEAGTGFTGTEMESSAGLGVGNLDVAGALRSDRLSAERLHAGDYDHASVEIWIVNWQDVSQRLLLRKGHLGDVSHGDTGFAAELRGLAHLLDQPKGRIFGHSCDARLGDARCGAALAAASGVALAGGDARRFMASGLGGHPAGWFERGEIAFASGANAGRKMEVKSHGLSGGIATIELWQPLPAIVSAGDAFTLTPGCDKQFETCKAKFANARNFRGFPHMPGNDFIGSYPNRGDANSGAAIS